MTGDGAGGPLGDAWERLGAELAERRGQVAFVLAAVASLVTLRGLHEPTHEYAAVGVALLLVARAIALGRSLFGRHLLWSLGLLVAAHAADSGDHLLVSWIAVAAAGAVAGLPQRPPPAAGVDDRRHVWALVDTTAGDTLAPFSLRTDKAYLFSEDRSAAIAYRVRVGTAIASGDPVGDPGQYAAVIAEFVEHAESNGWRVAVIGASDRSLPMWREQGLRAISIGRDVTLDVHGFTLLGRRFRNLRQAVQRTHNAGVTTEIVCERDLTDTLRAELTDAMAGAGKGVHSRGFSMILDEPLAGVHPGTFVALARDRAGRVVAFQRYASADGGRELSLDVPWRVPGAPNGVDERLIVDVLRWGAQRDARCLSLAFAAFPDLFELRERTLLQQTAYRAVHLLDRFIRLESLYRFVRKFHAFGAVRYVALRPTQVVGVAVAALLLEFGGARSARRR